ncbi:uncharacterized protein [Pyxicephalus adspersus]|uniref:uncharacterized protein n=1 Tax=Pyxicephalus adspersus TaxID=30357 RepID=UPI003B5AB076
MLIYVDDILICFEQEGDEAEILKTLNQHFETKDLGDIKNYLGIQIEREENGSFLLNQKHKIQEIIETFGMENAKPVKSPMETNYLKEMNSQDTLLPTNTQYREAIEKLLYLTTATRPDIAASIGILCRKVSMPSQMDWNAVKPIIPYLKETLHYKLKLPVNDVSTLTGYVDADWAGVTSVRKSTIGYLFFQEVLSVGLADSSSLLHYLLLKQSTLQQRRQAKKLYI